jgi:hypothetical protein
MSLANSFIPVILIFLWNEDSNDYPTTQDHIREFSLNSLKKCVLNTFWPFFIL